MNQEILDYIEAHRQYGYDLLAELGQIPAPSNHEEKRAQFVCQWFHKNGAPQAFIDEALNVVCPIGVTETNPVTVFMAHLDVVFPDTDPLSLKVQEGRMCCPGIGDDTANLVALLLTAKYVLEQGLQPVDGKGFVFVANSGEEGLGNLKGSRKICESYAGRIAEFCSFDGYFEGLVRDAVGSERYRVEVCTEGGHSFGCFGKNAGRLHGAAVVVCHGGVLVHHGLAQLECKFRFAVPVGAAQDLVDALGDITHHFHGGLIPLVHICRGAVDVQDGFVCTCPPLGGGALHDVVADGDDKIRTVEHLIYIVLLGDADGPQAVFVIHGDDALCHHGVHHRDVQPVCHLGNSGSGMAAHRPGTYQNDRFLCLADELPGGSNVGGVCVDLVQMLSLQRHGIDRHLGDVLGQVDVGSTGLALFGVLEGKPHDLAHGIRADDLLGTLGDGLEHGGQVQILVAGQLHPVGAHLSGDGNQRCAVQIGVCHAGNKIGGTGSKGGKTHSGTSGKASVHICHKGSALLMAYRDKADMAVPDGKHQVQRFLAGDAEHHVHTFGFQTVHQHLCGGFCFFLHRINTPIVHKKQKRRCNPFGATLPLSASFYRFLLPSTRANFHKKCGLQRGRT